MRYQVCCWLFHIVQRNISVNFNFGATELALPVAHVWRRFAAQRDLARQWILQWPEHTASALIPLVFTKPSDNSEAALLALRLLYEQGHGELLQTVANRCSVQMYGLPWSSCLNRVQWTFTRHAFQKP